MGSFQNFRRASPSFLYGSPFSPGGGGRGLNETDNLGKKRVAKGFCVTCDRPKISSVMRDRDQISRVHGTRRHNVMRDLLFYKHVTHDLPIRFP